MSSREKNLIPILGGDLNCRYDDLNTLLENEFYYYSQNVDNYQNNHGKTYGKDLCNATKMFPLNHINLLGESFGGDCT